MPKSNGFVTRWSRRKLAARADIQEESPQAPVPELPDLDTLTPESDFRPFMDARIDATLRCAALKRLFTHPSFNVTDAMDVYVEDYTKAEPMPAEMLARLRHVRQALAGGSDGEPDEDERREAVADGPELDCPGPEEEHGA